MMKTGASALLAATVCFGTGVAGAAPLVNLNGLGYVQYGDGQSYSIPLSGLDIPSTPGAIKDLIVVATGAEGGPVTTNFAGQDDAYSTPTGKNGSPFFRTEAATNRANGTGITTQNANTWDSSLAALKTFLGSDQMVFLFNNNQVNSGASTNQNLAAWAQIHITDDGGNLVANSVFEFTNNGGKYAVFTEGGGGTPLGDVTTFTSSGLRNPTAGTNASTDYVLSGGEICLDASNNPVSCSSPGATQSVPHNLGADHVAYAILFPELNALMDSLFGNNSLDLSKYTFHMDLRLGCDPGAATADCVGRSLNNGYEQLFIGAASPNGCQPGDPTCNPPIPEPGTLFLAALAMIGVAAPRLRRRVHVTAT